MNYLEFIKNSEGFKKLSIENQKKVIMFEIKEAIRKHTMTAHSLSPRQALLVYDALLGKDANDDEFNLSLFNQIKSIMEVMQEEEITYITIRNKNLREMPEYVYNVDGKLIAIKADNNINSLSLVTSIIMAFDKSFLVSKENTRTLRK